MTAIKRLFAMTLTFASVLSLSACNMALLNPKGMIAADERHIMLTSALLMLIVVVPVIIMTFIFSFRYRAGNNQSTYAPEWSHSTILEIICWSIPCIIIATLGVITWTSSHRLDPYRSLDSHNVFNTIPFNNNKTLTIQAISLEWKWLFIYPDQHIATMNYVEFPVGVPVEFLITAEGPMNSFQILQLAGQIYAMAGMQTKLHLIADTVGDYQGISANFTGDGFSDMTFMAHVTTPTAFSQWVAKVKQAPAKLTMMTYNNLITPTAHEPIKNYSSADKTIFSTVMMKSMMPMNNNMMADQSEKNSSQQKKKAVS